MVKAFEDKDDGTAVQIMRRMLTLGAEHLSGKVQSAESREQRARGIAHRAKRKEDRA